VDESRAKQIAAMWRMTTMSGVTIHPTRAAVQAMENLGVDMSDVAPLLREAEALYTAQSWGRLAMVLAQVNAVIAAALPRVRGEEPSTWSEYRAKSPAAMGSRSRPVVPGGVPTRARSGVPVDYADRVRAAWVGQCIGTALGDPVEGWTSAEIAVRHAPISGYLAQPKLENDDTAYPLLVLHTLDEYGPAFTSTDLALEWIGHLPFAYTAEWAAIENVKAGIFPPESRWPRNPCGAWVGGQMRTTVHGLLAPLAPERAAELAFRDAAISHFREGMDGAIYAAALASLAFSGRPIEDLLRAALRFVPSEGVFAATVERSLDACRRRGEWRSALDELRPELDRYHWIHTIPNIACVVVGLVLGDGDFERAILTTLQCGYDTDCTTGQVGAVMGGLLGSEGIPPRWSEPIGVALASYVEGFEEIGFDELVAWTTRWGVRLEAEAAGESPLRRDPQARSSERAA
jgi:ADP-ribosylglycohydrolase